MKTRKIARPRLVFFNHCEDITFHGITGRNSASWNFHPFFSKRVHFYNTAVEAPKDSPNTDGTDPESCDDVAYIGMRFSVGDDAIAIKAGKVYMGVSPEEGNIVGAFDVIREFRDTYYPDMEIWLTEFGWDTNQSFKTATSAHAYGDYTGRQVQGMWLIREYLLLSSIGVERAAMYMSRDCGPEETSVGKYGTSGIICAPCERKGYVVQGNKKDSY